MPRIAHSSRPARVLSLIGVLTLIAGLVLVLTAAVAGAGTHGGSPAVGTQNVALHNDTTGSTDCPHQTDPTKSYWHFIIAPNSGTYSFVTITLHVGGTIYVFTGAHIIPNGSQTDNVFIEVPAGHTVTDLQKSGSSADITPASPAPNKFNLSGTCACRQTTTSTTRYATTTTSSSTTTVYATTTTTGSSTSTSTTIPPTTSTTTTSTTMPPTTTTTVPAATTTTTTVPDTTSTSTTVPTTDTSASSTSTTIFATTSTSTTVPTTETTATTLPETTTTSTVPTTDTTGGASFEGPPQVLDASVTTVTPSNAAAAEAPDTGTLPRTGGGGGSGLIVGLGLLIAGGALVLGTRRSLSRVL